MMIYNDKHYNLDCITLENENLRLKVIPKIGFKLASITYRGKEFLFQPTNLKYSIPNYGDPFIEFDTSGLDEMIPTIDSCLLNNKILLPDHGDVWSIPWDVDVKDNSLIGRVDLKSLPIKFEKRISIVNDGIINMNYKVKNTTMVEQSYLWALHGLNNFDSNTTLIIPKGITKLLDVINNEVIDNGIEQLLDLRNNGDMRSYKYYSLEELSIGECGLLYKDCGLRYMIKFDKSINPYLGIWINKGGFKGEYNCALEPSNGFYDSLDLAIKNDKYDKIMPFEEKEWTIDIEIVEEI